VDRLADNDDDDDTVMADEENGLASLCSEFMLNKK